MFPVPASGNLAPAPVPVPTQAPAQQHGNPAPQAPNTAPQVNNVVVPDDPRGTKRSRENDPQDSDEPVLKLARTEPAAEPNGPEQQLISAIKSGDLQSVQILIGRSRQLANGYLPEPDGLTPLCLAAQCDRHAIAGYLLSSGCAINAPARNGSTPLMFASQRGHVEMIRQLCLSGADPKAVNLTSGFDALIFAICAKHLEACKELITIGADMERGSMHGKQGGETTPLGFAISGDFVELIDWYLSSKKILGDFREPSGSMRELWLSGLLSSAVSKGALKVVRLLLQRGVNPDIGLMITPDHTELRGVWRVAFYFNRLEVIEYLLSTGFQIWLPTPRESSLVPSFGFGCSTDAYTHLASEPRPNIPAIRITDAQLRQHPERIIEGMAERCFLSSSSQQLSAVSWWCDQGLLTAMFGNQALMQNFIVGAALIGQNTFPPERYPSITGATQAQQSQILVEVLSDSLCSPEWPQRFSGFKLTLQGEQKMNQIAVAQGELLLKGVAHLRERFTHQVATLPDVCMNAYISLSHQLNEPDLYRRMTREWGLYDPVARAAIRLVKEAYEKLRAFPSQHIPPEFAAMSPSERLRHVIVDMLEEWDKIPELVETFLKCDSQCLDVVSELLFQQWRLLGEAFGVTKPRYSQFGPHRPEVEPVVDKGRTTTLAPTPLNPQ